MHNSYLLGFRKQTLITAIALLLLSFSQYSISFAEDVVVRVKIEQTEWFCGDGIFGGPPEIYFKVNINGSILNSRNNVIHSNFSPFTVNREFSQTVDFSAGSINISIEQWDEDGLLTFNDDHCDITSNAGKNLDITLDLANCLISGEANGECNMSLSGRGSFRFRVNVDEPPSAPGLQTTCIHDPLWPQPGDTVQISANSLDGTLNSKLADSIEIWVNEQDSPAFAASGSSATFTAGPFTNSTFTYGCRILDDGLTIWTGWRTVAVGTSDITRDFGNRVPVIFTGARSSHIDLVFYPDEDSYTDSTDPQFLTDVLTAIQNSYFTDKIYLDNQDKINYWIALETGKADGFTDGDCLLEANQKAWEDAGAVFHTDSLRDCAPGGQRLYSSEPNSFGTILHETGHRPFGLADEYCCDGGYFQADPFPNIYAAFPDTILSSSIIIPGCAGDAFNVGKTDSDCRSWVDPVPWWFDDTWWTSDPGSDDIMVDSGARQALDNRRMNWLFDVCRGAGC